MSEPLSACRTADPIDDRLVNRARDWMIRGFVLLTIAAVLISLGVAVVTRNERAVTNTLRLLRPSPSIEEATRASRESPQPFWGYAYAGAMGSSPFDETSNGALCDVQTQYFLSGKNGGWRTERRNSFSAGKPLLTFGDETHAVVIDPRSRVEMTPLRPTEQVGARDESRYRQSLYATTGSRLQVQCLQEGKIFIDGCIDSNELGGCPDGRVLVITQGRLGERLAIEGLPFAYAVLILLLILCTGSVLLLQVLRGHSAETSLAHALSTRPTAPQSLRKYLRFAALPLPFVLLVWLTPLPAAVSYAWGAVMATAMLAQNLWGKRAKLLSQIAVIDAHPTTPLAHAEGEQVELQVRVKQDAPTQRAPLSGQQATHASLQIWQRMVVSSGRSSKVEYTFLFSKVLFGEKVPIVDASGDGMLDLSDAFLDFSAAQRMAWSASQVPTELHAMLNLQSDGAYLLRESLLQPGEALYVLGPVQRERSADMSVNYRAAPSTARVTADDGTPYQSSPLFVHAGTELSLLDRLHRAVRRETRFFNLCRVSAVLAATILLGLTATILFL